MENKKIIFMGTPSISYHHLKSLISNNYKIESVFTQPPRKKNRGLKIQESPVHKFAEENNLGVFRGDEIDVLNRYYNCAKKFQIENIVRITSDNPYYCAICISKRRREYGNTINK